MSLPPYVVLVDGPGINDSDLVQSALADLTAKARGEGRTIVVARIRDGGASMHAFWWAHGMGQPCIHLPVPVIKKGHPPYEFDYGRAPLMTYEIFGRLDLALLFLSRKTGFESDVLTAIENATKVHEGRVEYFWSRK